MNTELLQKIEELSRQITELAQHHSTMGKRLLSLMDELEQLKSEAARADISPPATPRTVEVKTLHQQTQQQSPQQPSQRAAASTVRPQKKSPTFEEFIGGNIASKAGILITIIGIFIGTKYAIENNLVSPVVRIISGYLSGLVLIALAIRLRKKYEQYSAVLMGGGLAVLYFITYIAYSFYGMMPQMAAFALMLLFTAATVYAALSYNQVIIAHVGLIGAYAIPILLSDQSGRYAVLFTYIAIINAGILIISFKRNWKSLYHVSFVLTWLIFSFWSVFDYNDRYFSIAMIFLVIFFFIFYATFLAYKLVKKEQYSTWDVVLLLSNAFIFYGLGYNLLTGNPRTDHLEGAFTLANAVIHLAVSVGVHRLKLADRALFYLLLGLVLTFVTIAIPVQLNGNWVTLLWTAEAVLIFYIGRTQQRGGYEKIAVAVALLSFFSLIHDWSFHLGSYYMNETGDWIGPRPFINVVFLTGILVAIAQGAILWIHRNKSLSQPVNNAALHRQFYNYVLPCLFFLAAYLVTEIEINLFFSKQSALPGNKSFAGEIDAFSILVTLLYSLTFVGIVNYVNLRLTRNYLVGAAAVLAGVIVTTALLTTGMPVANYLTELFLTNQQTYAGIWYVLIRYLLYLAAALVLYGGLRSLRLFVPERIFHIIYSVIIHLAVLTLLSYEYVNWARFLQSKNEYKLGLSIVWSVYALGLVVAGINKKKRHWRITGIFFFLVTMVKLFLFDLNQTSTISKTLSFISLGAILLLVSYLYNRYKHVILAGDEEKI